MWLDLLHINSYISDNYCMDLKTETIDKYICIYIKNFSDIKEKLSMVQDDSLRGSPRLINVNHIII